MSLRSADRSVAELAEFFATRGLEIGIVVPTSTGLEKSILDAHAGLRSYLKSKGIHDYDAQGQGAKANGVGLEGFLVTLRDLVPSNVSLYRPETKSGDPRIWFSGLREYARPGNVLAVFANERRLYVVNGSDSALMDSSNDTDSVLGKLLLETASKLSPAASELMERLRSVSRLGYVSSMRTGPTGVGFTLETLLGIEANSSKAPDFRGIELKASRTRDGGLATTRTTLFSKTPDWRASRYSAIQLLQKFGRPNDAGRKQIYCSLRNEPNSTFRFYLHCDEDADKLYAIRSEHQHSDVANDERLLEWPMSEIRKALIAKHRETFWVKAQTRDTEGIEHFNYYEVVHTRAPMPTNLPLLINAGNVELDLVLHLKQGSNGQPRVRDHGYLFKLWERHRSLLFATPRTYRIN